MTGSVLAPVSALPDCAGLCEKLTADSGAGAPILHTLWASHTVQLCALMPEYVPAGQGVQLCCPLTTVDTVPAEQVVSGAVAYPLNTGDWEKNTPEELTVAICVSAVEA